MSGSPQVVQMEAAEFTQRLAAMSSHDVEEVARALQCQMGSAEGEVAWWKATIAIDRSLKRHGRSRQAGRIAWEAAHAVLTAAEREAMLPDRKSEVTLVARAAADVARGLIAGGAAAIPLAALLNVWRPLLLPAVA